MLTMCSIVEIQRQNVKGAATYESKCIRLKIKRFSWRVHKERKARLSKLLEDLSFELCIRASILLAYRCFHIARKSRIFNILFPTFYSLFRGYWGTLAHFFVEFCSMCYVLLLVQYVFMIRIILIYYKIYLLMINVQNWKPC